ncbi:OmpP1/FadL family transporter [Sulfurospirillum barnesii]|uniref:Long-chain fatty acid transport protein n=1 Tax=Sulfurospirillum barnesii (strain ATCC 700032 / DSM 10660 / SES-3) TaxID=760154 RepID=I3XU56_SULBS|nr:outer membrane protein transport protein [Sulfurospirillum barnesii]AFL67480.1 long-chain fatty acid transport protein [Sulfurospirillum barnesii SES-3]
MKQTVKVATLLSLSAATLLASGYRIPEQSLNSVALSAAYVASANGADASYYNPANMAFMAEGGYIETSLTYINLPKVDYTDSGNSAQNGDSKEENFLLPNLHYVSPMVGNWRYGLSIVAPAGLSKRWDESYQMRSSEEFTLKVIEINPTASYKVNDQLALGFGLRGVYTTGVIKYQRAGVYTNDMEADSIDFGYNLALSYKPIEDLTLSATYRSKVNLTVDGDATTTWLGAPSSGDVKTKIPLPASLALAAAYTMDKTTLEFVFERTYWSSYKELDFDFENPTAEQNLGGSRAKNWKDVNAYRIGLSHQYSDALKLMAGFAIDKTPVPTSTLGFELPDSDAKLYSVGFEYKVSQSLKVGLAYLYDEKEKRSTTTNLAGVNGKFTDSAAHLVTASLKYKF